MSARSYEAQPIASMNITPLIDVLLVLLVMLILTIPMMTHKVSVDLPQPNTTSMPPAKAHRLDIAASGALSFDGAALNEAALPDRLAAMATEKDALLTIAANEAAPYGTFDRVLATIRRNGVTRLGFIGNDRFARAF